MQEVSNIGEGPKKIMGKWQIVRELSKKPHWNGQSYFLFCYNTFYASAGGQLEATFQHPNKRRPASGRLSVRLVTQKDEISAMFFKYSALFSVGHCMTLFFFLFFWLTTWSALNFWRNNLLAALPCGGHKCLFCHGICPAFPGFQSGGILFFPWCVIFSLILFDTSIILPARNISGKFKWQPLMEFELFDFILT